MKKKIKINLLVKILIAIALGIGCGQFFPVWAGRIFVTFNAVFSQFLNFMIPLIIVGFVAPAIADVGKNAGKMLIATVAIAYIFTSISGFYSYFVSASFFPDLISSNAFTDEMKNANDLQPYFTIGIPALLDVMTALVFAFMIGICMAYLGSSHIKKVCDEFSEIISMVISKAIIPLLPIYIFGIFLNMTVAGQVVTVLGAFASIIGIIFAMTVLLLVFQFCIAAIFSHKNPFKMLGKMLPAYFTALGTQSSAATIPVTLRQTIKIGVSEDVAGFVIPLCATIHMSGSALKITSCAIAIMIMKGMPIDITMFSGFIMMLGITMVAAPGVPGGAIMAALGILGSILGFNADDLALMIALYITMDSFGTACNVTGDASVAVIIDHFFGSGNTTETEKRDAMILEEDVI